MSVSLAQYWSFLAKYLRPHTLKAYILGLLLLTGICLQLVMPQITRSFIDIAQHQGSLHTLIIAAWAFLIAGVISQLCNACAGYLGADVGWLATNTLRADLALHCLRLDMPFHQTKTPGEMIERIDGDVNALANFFSQFLVTVFGNALLLLGVLAFLWREDWRVGLAFTVITIIAWFSLMKTRDLAVPVQRTEREQVAALMGFVEERLGGLDDIRANGLGAHVQRAFAVLVRKLYHIGMKAGILRCLIWLQTMLFFLLGTLVAVVLGFVLYQHGLITLGTVFMIYQYNTMLRMPLEQITRQIQDLQQAGAGLLRVQELLAESPAITDGPGASLPAGPLSVEFDGVTFAYGDADSVLLDINLKLESGRVLGVLGRTGSGKTTLTRLLFRLYDVNEGMVRVGGVDIRDMRLADLRQRIGMVTQEVQLFHATVRDNLTFFDPSITDERILAVIDDLGLQDWLAKLPDGLDTELQAGGSGLSAGESQLLAFTRVFLANPGLILLDEPSSRLDPATERLINHAVDRLLQGRTCLIIAHRLGTVQRADDILVMEDGCVAEYGPREALAADPASHFARLLRAGLEQPEEVA